MEQWVLSGQPLGATIGFGTKEDMVAYGEKRASELKERGFPVNDDIEMQADPEVVEARLNELPYYREQFKAVINADRVTLDDAAKAPKILKISCPPASWWWHRVPTWRRSTPGSTANTPPTSSGSTARKASASTSPPAS